MLFEKHELRSSVVNIVDQNVLLNDWIMMVGVGDVALDWFSSYLKDNFLLGLG